MEPCRKPTPSLQPHSAVTFNKPANRQRTRQPGAQINIPDTFDALLPKRLK